MLLLHGLVTGVDTLGTTNDALAEHATVVVPDLLGSGPSMGTAGATDAAAHTMALDAASAAPGSEHRPDGRRRAPLYRTRRDR